jgi:hypothetical protein
MQSENETGKKLITRIPAGVMNSKLETFYLEYSLRDLIFLVCFII